MNKCRSLMLSLLLVISPQMRALDAVIAAAIAAGGFLVGASSEHLFKKATDKTAKEQRSNTIKINFESHKLHYNDVPEIVNLEVDQKIRRINTLRRREGHTIQEYEKKVDEDVHNLSEDLAFVENSSEDRDKQMAQNIKTMLPALQEFSKTIKEERPFLELDDAQHNEEEQLRNYELALTSRKPFRYISTVELIDNDIRGLMYIVRHARDYCEQKKCVKLQEDLIRNGNQQLDTITQMKRAVVESDDFIEEHKRFEKQRAKEKKAEERTEELRVEREKIEIAKQKNELKLAKLKMMEQTLEHKLEKCQAENKELQNKVAQSEDDSHILQETIRQKDLENTKLSKELNECRQMIKSVQNEAQEFGQQLAKQRPVSPESEEGEILAGWSDRAQAFLRKIEQIIS